MLDIDIFATIFSRYRYICYNNVCGSLLAIFSPACAPPIAINRLPADCFQEISATISYNRDLYISATILYNRDLYIFATISAREIGCLTYISATISSNGTLW